MHLPFIRLYPALCGVVLLGAACSIGDAPTSVSDGGPIALAIVPTLAPAAADGIPEPINRIRARVVLVPENVLIEEVVRSVDPEADSWAVALTVPASAEGTVVVIEVDLIHVADDGTEAVQYSGRSDPITLTPGFSDTVEIPIEGAGPTGLVGNVYVASTGAGLAGATVDIQDTNADSTVATLTTDADGGYQLDTIPAGDYRLTASAAGYQPGIGFASVVDGVTTTAAPIGLITGTGPGDLSGTVQNAVNPSEHIVGATVELRAGAGAPDTEPVVSSTTTNTAGDFIFAGVTAGNYTIRTVASDYADGRANVVVQAGTSVTRIVLMSPGLIAGELRTVLTWGPALPEVASDLDSHLTGPHNGLAAANATYHVDAIGGGRFHIAFYSPGTLDDVPGAQLQNDETAYEGPETTTIGQVLTGTYRFTVDLYCCTATIRTSQAKVQVFDAAGLKAEFNVPNQDGQTWIVFDLVDGQIVPINRVVQGRNQDYAQHDLAHPTAGGPVSPPPGAPPAGGELHSKAAPAR